MVGEEDSEDFHVVNLAMDYINSLSSILPHVTLKPKEIHVNSDASGLRNIQAGKDIVYSVPLYFDII